MNTRHLWTVVIWLLAVLPIVCLVGEESARFLPNWVKVAAVAFNALIALIGSTLMACEIEDRARK